MHGRNAQVARIYRILSILEGTPHGLTALELKERLNERGHEVSKRTVYRDLEALSDAGFPLFPSEQGADEAVTRWVLEKHAKVGQYLAFSSEELFALYLMRGMLSHLKSSPVHSDFERAFAKIEEKLGKAHREYLAELAADVKFEKAPGTGQALDLELLATVRAACAEGQALSVDYESVHSGTSKRRRLGPHYLYFAKGSVYLLAEELETRETKLFALPRMRNAVMEDDSYDGKGLGQQKHFESSFGVYQGKRAVPVKVAFSKRLAAFVRERHWHPSQSIQPQADGALELKMTVALTPELVQWILGFGPEAQVLEPKDLRADVASAIAQMADKYCRDNV